MLLSMIFYQRGQLLFLLLKIAVICCHHQGLVCMCTHHAICGNHAMAGNPAVCQVTLLLFVFVC